MYTIYHIFPINVSADKVFQGVSTPEGLDQWWTKKSSGSPVMGATYSLFFGPSYDWKGVVTKNEKNSEFELEITEAEPEWMTTRIGFRLERKSPDKTEVNFYHRGWPEISENYKVSTYCWAMYLRILKRYLEFAEQVPYEKRLNV